jgi:large subunit ribosomal protein L5
MFPYVLSNSELKELIRSDFPETNYHSLYSVEKIVLNIGFGNASQNSKLMEETLRLLGLISSQKPLVTRAKKSIAGFKLRQHMPIGAMVTLRGRKMFLFLNKLIHLVLPRIRDFKGISGKSFDGSGNLNIGIKDLLLFTDVDFDMVTHLRGLNISIVTNSDDKTAKQVLQKLGMPFAGA